MREVDYMLGLTYGMILSTVCKKSDADFCTAMHEPITALQKIYKYACAQDAVSKDLICKIADNFANAEIVDSHDHDLNAWMKGFIDAPEMRNAHVFMKLKPLRISANMSQSDVACSLGVSQSFVSRIESGKVAPSEDMVQRLNALFSDPPL